MKPNESAKDVTTKRAARSTTLLVMLLVALCAWQAQGQVPALMNYQGRLVDVNGANLPDGDYQITFNIFNVPSGGTATWGPFTVASVPVIGGFFNVVLGPNDSATPTPRGLTSAFGGANAYLEIQVTNGPPLSPRQQLLSAPYSLKSQDAILFGGTNWGAVFDNADPATGKFISSKLANDSVNSSIIANGTVATADLADQSITASKFNSTVGVWARSGSVLSYIGGNVGIGTASPTTPLQVNGTVTATLFSGSGANLTALSAPQLTGLIDDARLSGNVARENSQNTFSVQQFFSANIGIGSGAGTLNQLLTVGVPETPVVSSPRAGFYNAGSTFIAIRNTSSDIETAIGADTVGSILASMSDTPLVFRAGNGTGAGNVEHMRIAPGGNVGIGLTTPSERLEIESGGNMRLSKSYFTVGARFSVASTLVGGGTLHLHGAEEEKFGLPVAVPPRIELSEANHSSTPAKITCTFESSTNRINIVSADFEAGRDIFFPALTTGTGTPLVWQSATGKIVRETSSLRYKENVQALQDEFAKVLTLEPKRYIRKDDPASSEVGYIAEELDAAGLQSLTIYDEHGKPDAINYGKIVIYSNEVLKEHQRRIREQQEEIETLREQLKELKDLVLRENKSQE